MTEQTRVIASTEHRAGLVMRVPERWTRFMRRVLALKPGMRYTIVLTVGEDECDWSVVNQAKVEK